MKLAVAGSVALVLVASTARAQPNQADLEKARDREADARFEAALKLHDAGREPEARTQLEQAHAIAPDDESILLNLARSEQLTGDTLAAIRHLRACLDLPKTKQTPELTAKATKRLEELRRLVAHVVVAAPREASELTIDGTGIKPGEVADVAAGRHVVQAKVDGREWTTEVVAAVGATITARLSAPPHGEGSLTTLGLAPPAREDTSAREKPHPLNAAKWITVGAVGAAAATSLIVGAAFWGAASSAADDVAHLQQTAPKSCSSSGSNTGCSDLHDALQRQDDDDHLRTAFLAAGVGFAIAATAIAFVWKDPPRDAISWTIAPSISHTSFGAAAHLTF